MAAQALPISSLVSATVELSPQAAQMQNLGTLLVVGTSTVIDVVKRLRSYTSLAQVTADFGTSSPEYAAAVLWFEQSPQPGTLLIGRWAQTASAGELIGAPLTAAQQVALLAVASAGVDITVDGVAHNLSAMNFHGQTNLNGIASVLSVALYGYATVVWDSAYSRFVVTSASTGASSIVGFGTTGAGTDVSAMLGLTSTSSGAYQANGIASETALACVTLLDQLFGRQWYGLEVVTGASDSDRVSIAAYIQASTNKHFFGVTTSEGGVITPGDTTSIAYLLKSAALDKGAVQYSSTTSHAVASLLARILTTNWTGNNTTITLMYKQEPGVTAETLTPTQLAALLAVNANVFVNYDNDTAIIEPGITPSGQWIDTVIGTDWLALAIQNALWNVLYTTPTKIPQTDSGMAILAAAIRGVCIQAVGNGLLAPGVWTGPLFGQLQNDNQGNPPFLAEGFYVYTPPVSSQSSADRAARKSVLFQIAAKLGGAVHSANALIVVNS